MSVVVEMTAHFTWCTRNKIQYNPWPAEATNKTQTHTRLRRALRLRRGPRGASTCRVLRNARGLGTISDGPGLWDTLPLSLQRCRCGLEHAPGGRGGRALSGRGVVAEAVGGLRRVSGGATREGGVEGGHLDRLRGGEVPREPEPTGGRVQGVCWDVPRTSVGGGSLAELVYTRFS